MKALKITGEKRQVVEVLVDSLKKNYAEDVALMVCYGSAVTGPMTTFSDVDFFVIPKTDKGYKAARQFVLNDIGYDLWCVDWEFLEDAASYKNPLTSLVDHGVVVYADGPSSEERFNQLKKQVVSRRGSVELLKLVNNRLVRAQSKLVKILESKSFDNDGYFELAEEVYYTVLYVNQDFSLKGPINAIEELKRYNDLPNEIMALYEVKESFDEEVAFKTAASALIALENYVEIKTKESVSQEADSLDGFYEELKSTYNKLYRACDEENRWRVWVCLKMIERDVQDVLGPIASELPTLKGLKNLAFDMIYDRVKLHEKDLLSTLIINGANIQIFDKVDDLKKYLEACHA